MPTAAMTIPGGADPVPVPRAPTAREDGRVDLVGLNKAEMAAALVAAGVPEKQAIKGAHRVVVKLVRQGASPALQQRMSPC